MRDEPGQVAPAATADIGGRLAWMEDAEHEPSQGRVLDGSMPSRKRRRLPLIDLQRALIHAVLRGNHSSRA
jgi:hypothetical protein